jgi:hypothetical protein
MASEKENDTFILNALTCPITLELFVDPVLADDGHTYERSAIVEWIKYHNGTSPMTRQRIKIKELKTNRIIKQLADQYLTSSVSQVRVVTGLAQPVRLKWLDRPVFTGFCRSRKFL